MSQRNGWAAGALLALLALLEGCAIVPIEESAAPSAGSPPLSPDEEAALVALAGGDLPPGEGRSILARRCTGCHNLGGLWAYQGYYDEARWRGLVQTMIAHGANLNETEENELVAYLARHFGPGTR
jgi:hypothetical protein